MRKQELGHDQNIPVDLVCDPPGDQLPSAIAADPVTIVTLSDSCINGASHKAGHEAATIAVLFEFGRVE